MTPPDPPEDPKSTPEESPFEPAIRAGKRFLLPFLFSWAVAYVGSARGLDWLHFTGLGGVCISMLVLLIWLIR